MPHTTLVDTETLARELESPTLVVVDCRFTLDDPAWGEREYRSGHVPGAVYAHLDRDLSGPTTGTNGRHPLPDPETLSRRLGSMGIDANVQVVAYDQDSGVFASRLWWLLRWLGHEAVAVLDGGFKKWIAEGRPTRSGVESRPTRPFRGAVQPHAVASVTDVLARFENPSWRLIDARAPERFRGETEPLDRVPGHIPGAGNHFFKWNLESAGTFRAPAELRTLLGRVMEGTPPDRVICYCGSGVTACHNLLALEHAGLEGSKLYPGSWSEWASDPHRPVATDV